MKNFRRHHLLRALEEYNESKLPIDKVLYNYFKQNKSLGSKDRKEVAETIYTCIRWQGLYDYFCEKPITWKQRIEQYECVRHKQQYENLPKHIRVSFPKELYEQLALSLNEEVEKFCLLSNEQAPITLRVNPLKTTREKLLSKLNECFTASSCRHAPYGIHLSKRASLFSMQEFKQGHFEMQDEGSQILCELVEPKDRSHILDYCAGSGGKTLGYAYKLKGKGQLYLYDVRSNALMQAKKRLNRAGIQNVQIIKSKEKLESFTFDYIFIDAPCSGSGTYRRNPDLKWRFSKDWLMKLIDLQRSIVSHAYTLLKPKGTLIYATCSVLKQENDDQVNYFLKHLPLQLQRSIHTHHIDKKMDGFFGAVFNKCKTT